jgi:hypothetical protein
VTAGPCGLDGLIRVQATRCAQRHQVSYIGREEIAEVVKPSDIRPRDRAGECLAIAVADSRQLYPVGVLVDGSEMIAGNPATADDCYANAPINDSWSA